MSPVFERFVKQSPVTVMTRALMERALDREVLDRLFRARANAQYEKDLLFSMLVDVMSLVVCRVHPSVRKAYQALQAQIPVSLSALYAKLNGVEVGTSEALVADCAERLRPVLCALGAPTTPWLPGYRIKTLDGNHLAATEHRIDVLRDCAAGPLPGQALVVFEPEIGLATQMVGCEDGHAQERSLLDPVLAGVCANDVYIADRNFCTLRFLHEIAKSDGFFVIRQHASMPVTITGKLRRKGRTDSGILFEQDALVRLGDRELRVRRIVIRLDVPTRDGATELSILTNLPKAAAKAATVADLYRRRWTIESFFGRVERDLQSEICTLGYPSAALFAFAVALVAANIFSATQTAMVCTQQVHADPKVREMPISDLAVVEEVRSVHRGMAIVVPDEDWQPFQTMPPKRFAKSLIGWARNIRWEPFRKAVRGPKRPRAKRSRYLNTPHVSTARLLLGG